MHELKKQEKEKVLQDLSLNGYTKSFISNASKKTKKFQPSQPVQVRGRTCLPYVKGVSERLKRVLEKAGVQAALKPCQTLADVFRLPKERSTVNRVKGIVYKVKCNSCHLHILVKQRERGKLDGWSKPEVRKQNYSAVKDHAETTGHEVRSTDVEMLERRVNNHQKRLFLEAIHSVRTKYSVKEHIEFPHVYLPLITSLGT